MPDYLIALISGCWCIRICE